MLTELYNDILWVHNYISEVIIYSRHENSSVGVLCMQVRESTGARIIFPASGDTDQELITIMGKEDSVKRAKQELETLIKNLVSNTS